MGAGRVRLAVMIAVAVALACDCGPSYQRQPLLARNDIVAVELCALGAALPPLSGRLVVDRTAAPVYVWLVDPSGGQLHVVWPPGFAVEFRPIEVVLDPSGVAIAARGAEVVFGQVSPASHKGTLADPYPLVGMIGERCYSELRVP